MYGPFCIVLDSANMWLRIFTSIFIKDISLYYFLLSVLVYYWLQDNGSLVEWIWECCNLLWGFPSGSLVDSACKAGDLGDMGSIPGWGRSPGGFHGNPHQYSCLENPMKRGAQWVTVHSTAKSWTQQKQLSTHTCMYTSQFFWNYLRRIDISSFYVWYKSPMKLLVLNFNFLGVFLKLQIQFYY